MKPLQHALIAAHRYGGAWQDWIPVHAWFDLTKSHFASVQHRMLLHSDLGRELALRVFGAVQTARDGTTVPTCQLIDDHQREDLGSLVPLADWLQHLDSAALEQARLAARRRAPRPLEAIAADPLAGLAARWGGQTERYAPLVAFFDAPARLTNGSEKALWVLHHSLGIYLAEQVFGVALDVGGKLVSTRSIGEDLILARVGFIPSAAAVLARVALRPWMRGAAVGAALRERALAEREAAALVARGAALRARVPGAAAAR